MKKVLVIEDDRNLSELIELHLKDLNCEVEKTAEGRVGLESALENNFDLIVLDLMLPDIDGLDVARKLRQMSIKTPILILTAKSEEIDKVLGLESGADDYLTKPFSIREFIARVKAIFRRTDMLLEEKAELEETMIKYGNLKIDKEKRLVMIDDKRIDLTPKEFDLLALLASNPGKSYPRGRLLSLIWGYQFEGYEHTVNSHINRLRSKIEPDVSNPKYVLTSWGFGYRFNDQL